MPNRNVQRRVATWWKKTEPMVGFVDQLLVDSFERSSVPTKSPTAPGWWWSANDGWTGPFDTEFKAREEGRAFLKAYFAPTPSR